MTDTAEKCKGCTIKHLSDVLVWLHDVDTPEKVRNAYISGNLSHAANHFVHYSPVIADRIRQLRLDCIGMDLSLSLSPAEIETALRAIISDVAAYVEPVQPVTPVPVARSVDAPTPRSSKGGCRCRKNN